METLFSLFMPYKLRQGLRKPRNILLLQFFLSGWLREMIFSVMPRNWSLLSLAQKFFANDASKNTAFNSILRSLLWEIAPTTAVVFIVIWLVCRVVVDLPGYTKALFWGVTRAYEHGLSRLETVVLLSLPCAIAATILLSGYASISAWLITGLALAFHSSSYNFRRLRNRTDDVMRSRAHLGMFQPPADQGR